MKVLKLILICFLYLNYQIPALGFVPVEVRVAGEGQYSSFGIYNQSPESPDGSRIAYIVFDYPPKDRRKTAPASLYVCKRDLTKHRLVRRLEFEVTSHNGAFENWIDNDSVAYSGGHWFKGDVRVVNIDTGKNEHGPFTGGFCSGNNFDGKLMMNIWDPETNLGKQGLFELDTKTGKVRCIFENKDFVGYKDKWKGSDDPKCWAFTHSNYSADGSHIAFNVCVGNLLDANCIQQYTFTAKSDGSDLRYWGPDIPMHSHWYDEDTLWGSDYWTEDGSCDNHYMKRWTRDKELIEVLAGLGNHTAISPDKMCLAAETDYRRDPVELRVFRRGEIEPAAVIFSHSFTVITWQKRAHVNPSFSRDGTRLYYNRAVSDNLKQAYYCDLSALVSEKSSNCNP